MLTITKREHIGFIHGKAIYRVAAFQILPLAENLSTLNENQVKKCNQCCCGIIANFQDYNK
jgi:hypothetical protein